MYADITRILSAAVIVIGLVVIIGWLIDIDTLKSIIPTWVTMKFSTAVSFLMSGIVVMLMNEYRNNNSEFSRIFLFAPLIIILFFMATLLVTTTMGTTSGVSSLFVKEDPGAIGSLKAGTPSIGTMINFLLIIGVGFTSLLIDKKYKKYSLISGGIVLALGIIALLGYAIEEPTLYYQVEGFSGAMAIHTAIAFCLIGIGMILFIKPQIQEKEVSKKRFALPISAKLVFFFLIAAIIPIVVVGVVSFDLAESSLERETFQALNEQADINLDRLEDFFGERIADAEVTSRIKLLEQEIPILEKFLDDQTNIAYIESEARVDQRLDAIEAAYGYDSIALTNSEGIFVYVTKEAAKLVIGTTLQDLDFQTYDHGKNEVYTSQILPDVGADGLPELLVSAPILDDEDNLVGILVLDVPIQRLLTEAMGLTYVGETGESLLVALINEKMVFLHPVRFDENITTLDAMAMEQGASGPARKALLGVEGADVRIDYRNEQVLAAWRYIPSLDWGLVSKVDSAEAFAPIEQLKQDIIILAIVFSAGIGIFGITASRSFSGPILKLKELAIEISKGNLDSKVKVQSTDEIGQLSEMLNETGEKLKKAEKEKQEFVAMITHDLKQPLVPISGNAEMLNNPKMGELNEMQRDCVAEIQANASKQLSMIDNLVSAQKLGLGAMKFDTEELSTKNILKECIKTHTPAMTDKDIEYFDSSTIDVKVLGDNRRIQESFTNLILNAHDFVPENGKIEIGVTDGENEVTFFVKDDGEGIPKEKQEQLFKKYGQVKSKAKRKFGGTGLGLAVSQQLVEGMGGKIWVESEEGKGSTFFFTIPKA